MSVDTREKRFFEHIAYVTESGCWIWCGTITGAGYGILGGPNQSLHYAHRYSWELRYGKIADGMFICHKCDIPCCVNPLHLFAGTQKDNMADALKKMRIAHGEILSKLKLDDVRSIRKYLSDGKSQRWIAKKYQVNQSTISNIKTRDSWNCDI